MAKLEKIESGKVKLITKIDGEEWQKAQKDSFKKIARKVEIKGFRKGQAPENMVRSRVSNEEILIEAAQSVAQNALEKALDEHNVELIDRPTLNINTINDSECELSFECPTKPDVKLGQYKGLGYEVKKSTVKESEVNAELIRIQEQKAELELKEDGKVEKGDTAVIDFEGFKDGVAFEGGKGENYSLEIGSGSFIPGFEDQLIGMKSEEEKEINVKFPENYQAEELKGADATFKVKVHEIKTKKLPELNEELISELKIENVKTLEELKKHIKEQLKKNKDNQAENEATEALLTKLADGAEITIPEVMINTELENMFKDYENRMMSQGIDMATYFKITGSNKEQFLEMMKPEAEKKVKITLVLEEIAKVEKIKVSDKDVAKEYEEMSKYYGMEVEEFKKYVSEKQVEGDLLLRQALEFVKKN